MARPLPFIGPKLENDMVLCFDAITAAPKKLATD